MSSSSRIVITPFASMKGKMSLIVFSSISAAVLLTGILAYSFASKSDISILIFFLVLSFVIDSIGVILFIIFPRTSIIFDGETNQAVIRDSRKPEKRIPFSELQPFRIFDTVVRYTRQYFCLNSSFGEYSELFASSIHARTLRKAKSIVKLVKGNLMETDGRMISWNEVD